MRRLIRLKWVGTWSAAERLLRLFRVSWNRDGPGYREQLTLGWHPVLWRFERAWNGWTVTAFGLRSHYKVAGGGRFPD